LKKILFSGAKRPLWYLKKNNADIIKIKPTRRSIGGEQNENVPFKTQEVILPVGSILYMATDGFADQNDINRKKIGENKLEEILLKHKDRTLYSQKIKLELFLDDYKKGSEQRDDILLLGARI
jgi:serine phosphatase RsbU (regulator of sigma subunit)